MPAPVLALAVLLGVELLGGLGLVGLALVTLVVEAVRTTGTGWSDLVRVLGLLFGGVGLYGLVIGAVTLAALRGRRPWTVPVGGALHVVPVVAALVLLGSTGAYVLGLALVPLLVLALLASPVVRRWCRADGDAQS